MVDRNSATTPAVKVSPVNASAPPKAYEVVCVWTNTAVMAVKVEEKEGLHSCMREVHQAQLVLAHEDPEVLPRMELKVQSLAPLPFVEKGKYLVSVQKA